MATNPVHPEFKATIRASKDSLLLGPNLWNFYNDSKACSLESSYSQTVTLTTCSDEEYTCDDGNCVDMEKICDGKTECQDGSDENTCFMMVYPLGFHKSLTPPPEDGERNLVINVSVTIHNILDIDEVDGEFVTKITIQRDWFDSRLTYRNVKEDFLLNVLYPETRAALWRPTAVFHNIASEEKYKKSDLAELWSVQFDMNNKFSYTRDSSQTNNVLMFKGSEHKQVLKTQYTVEFMCDFDMRWYPFDTQVCGMDLYSSSAFSVFNPKSVNFSGPKVLAQYFVKSFKLCSKILEDQKGISVVIVLGRPLLSNILTIFIPTAILILISHVSKVFEEDHLEMVVMVSLTVILVQAQL